MPLPLSKKMGKNVAGSERRRRKIRHAIQRARERHGIELTELDVIHLNQQIWRGTARMIGKRRDAGVEYVVTTEGGKDLPVVYHNGLKSIVTVLD